MRILQTLSGLSGSWAFFLLLTIVGAEPPRSGSEGLSEPEKIGHVLNRLGYGPSLADSARIRAMGVGAYIEEQLRPGMADPDEIERLEKAFSPSKLEVVPSSATLLVRAGDRWRYFKGTREPPREWQGLAFNASQWPQGPSGFGYGDDDDRTVLEDMQGGEDQKGYLSFYVRTEFEVEDPSAISHLFLRVAYDDGFVGYLNGREILRMNLRGSPPRFDQVASRSSGTVERGEHDTFPVDSAIRWLRKGRNVLAFQVHNHRIGSSDLTLIPELAIAEETSAQVIPGIEQVQQRLHWRGVHSQRQLQAVLGEFWENHFCTDFDKVEDYIDDLPAYEIKQAMEGEDRVERQILSEAAGIELQEYEFFYNNAFGHFGDLLLYSATNPSMLIYLDSVLNLKAEPNENYAREILELYAMGVDNRYTQKDIEELSRCFTGWTIKKVSTAEAPPFPQSARSPSTDPSLAVAQEKVLMDLGPGWRYYKGRREPSPGRTSEAALRWTLPAFNDRSWPTGRAGFGYGDGDDATVLRDMQGRYVSVYLRRSIPIDLSVEADEVLLEVAYDDGYVAYLNGEEIARSANMLEAGSPPRFNYIVPENHEVDEGVDEIDLRAFKKFIKPPPALNTLAFQVHNGSRHSSDFSIRPRVVARTYKPGSVALTDPLGKWTFRFRPEEHDTGEKVLFEGTDHELRLPAGRMGREGVRDGIEVIDALVEHPSTAEFIVIKLLNKFVSDEISLEKYHQREGPEALLALADDAIAAWFSTPRPGHLGTVLTAIFDPVKQENFFWSRRAAQAKIKTPMEFVNSCYRALGARLVDGDLSERMDDMGMAMFRRDDPDGYAETGDEWMDTHNLLERLRFCQDLAVNGDYAAGRWSIERLMAEQRLRSPEEVVAHFDRLLFQGALPDRRREVFLDFVNTDDDGVPNPLPQLKGRAYWTRLQQMVGMILSTQEFQFQ